MSKYVFLKIETQQDFDDTDGYYPEYLNISLAVTFDYRSLYRHWGEDEIVSLVEYLNKFQFVIGYNLLEFDYKVLDSYREADHYAMEMLENKTIDLLTLIKEEITEEIQAITSLNGIAIATLNKKKSGNRLKAVRYWREGEIERLKRYCEEDVNLTVALFEYIQRNQCFFYFTEDGDKERTSISLPYGATKAELNIDALKTGLNAYFEILFAGETISKSQIKLLKDKTDTLIDYIENYAQGTFDSINDNDDQEDDNGNNDREDDQEEDDEYRQNLEGMDDGLPF